MTLDTPNPWPPVRRIAIISVHGCPLVTAGMRSAGGMNVHLRRLVPLLAERDICVDVFTRCHHPGGPEVLEIAPRARVIHLAAGSPELVKTEFLPYLPEFQWRLSEFAAADGLGYDLVHGHYWLSGSIGASVAAEWGIPHVVSFHTIADVKERAGGAPEPEERKAAEARMAAEANRIFASTRSEVEDLGELFGVPRERVHIVPGGVDLELFSPRPRAEARRRIGIDADEKVVLFVGRLERFKGPHVLVKALAQMRDPGSVRLVLVGGSQDEHSADWLRAMAAELGVESRLRWQAAIPQGDLPDFYSAADLCAVPSYHESFGLAALEAMACGTPVVAASVGALRSLIVDGRTGCLVKGHDPDDFARCLEELLDDPMRRMEMGLAARRRAQGFTWGRAADEALEGYAAALEGRVLRPEVTACAE